MRWCGRKAILPQWYALTSNDWSRVKGRFDFVFCSRVLLCGELVVSQVGQRYAIDIVFDDFIEAGPEAYCVAFESAFASSF